MVVSSLLVAALYGIVIFFLLDAFALRCISLCIQEEDVFLSE